MVSHQAIHQKQILTIATAALKAEQRVDTLHRTYPRIDYLELQKILDTDIINYNVYENMGIGKFLRNVETYIRSDLYLSLLSLLRKNRYELIFAMSERAGIPFAAANQLLPDRTPLVAMFQSWSYRQQLVISRLKLYNAMDRILVHCQSMKQVFIEVGAPAARLHVVPYGIDHRYFTPLADTPPQPNFIISVGEVRSRDYNTLFQAVTGLPVDMTVLASGMWYAREKNQQVGQKIPSNVTIRRGMSHHDLRQLYAKSQFVVLPVFDLPYSAGATASLEAMSMGRAVIATHSRGIRDFIQDGETGLLVKPNDAQHLREAIEYLLTNPDEVRRLGENGRQFVEEQHNMSTYVHAMRDILLEQCQTKS